MEEENVWDDPFRDEIECMQMWILVNVVVERLGMVTKTFSTLCVVWALELTLKLSSTYVVGKSNVSYFQVRFNFLLRSPANF
jgi:hypothetical protein